MGNEMNSANKEIINYLKACYLFDGFSEKQLNCFAQGVSEIVVEKGGVIIRENDQPDNIFIVKEGRVEIRKFDKETNLSHRLGFLGQGEVVGDMAFFDDTVRSASVIASEPPKLLVIPIAQLSQFNK